ncbi:MAG: hypothetical protein I8H71_01340 [Xanthomonadaceae bacterium]|nr:hypothetical protein [Xanthomonadaceae bacterium]
MPKRNPVGPSPKLFQINTLDQKNAVLGPPTQAPLFHVEKQVEYDGVEMGVLDNGIPYLTESGLARMCGIDRKVLNRLAVGWDDERFKPRGKQIAQLLQQHEYVEPTLYLKSEHKGSEINAYTEPVCLALLEYYAFIVEEPRQDALRAFRSMVRVTFRKFIYDAVGYSPDRRILDSWKHFYDRVDMTLDATPRDHFSVFRESAQIIVPLIRAGLLVSDKVVPDISIGQHWGRHWSANALECVYGARQPYLHNYPDYYPQAKSNPQQAHAYPNAALGEFRSWLENTFLAVKLPPYMLGQIKKGAIPEAIAHRAINALSAPSWRQIGT